MSLTNDQILEALRRITLPDGGDIVSRDFVRALNVDGGAVRFVLEVPAEKGPAMEPVRAAAEKLVAGLEGVTSATAILTAHVANPKSAPEFENRRSSQAASRA